MSSFDSDGIEIAYEQTGEGGAVLLIHGFASSGQVNWRDTSWVSTLVRAGHSAITYDNRGHGLSRKLYESSRYSSALMAEDARRLLDHLGLPQADVMGYSMGARIAALLAIAHKARIRRLVLGGLAANMMLGVGGAEDIARGLEAPSLADVTEPGARAFRKFAEQTQSDLRALAACMRSSRQRIEPEELARIAAPTLIVAGELDDIAGPLAPLVGVIPNARGLTLPARSHMNAVGERAFKEAVTAFLAD